MTDSNLEVQSQLQTQSTNRMIVTPAGAKLLAERGAKIGITSFRFADGHSYVPAGDQYTFAGKLTGVEEAPAPELVNGQLVYNLVIPPEVCYDFGEIGLFVRHTMVALIVEDSLIEVRYGGRPVSISCVLPLPTST